MASILAQIYIKYVTTVKMTELNERTHKLQKYRADGTKNTIEVYRLPHNPGLESVLHCIDVYKQKAANIGFDHNDLFNNFDKLCEGDDFECCGTARAEGTENDEDDFDDCMRRFVLNYCTADTKKEQFKHFTRSTKSTRNL